MNGWVGGCLAVNNYLWVVTMVYFAPLFSKGHLTTDPAIYHESVATSPTFTDTGFGHVSPIYTLRNS